MARNKYLLPKGITDGAYYLTSLNNTSYYLIELDNVNFNFKIIFFLNSENRKKGITSLERSTLRMLYMYVCLLLCV